MIPGTAISKLDDDTVWDAINSVVRSAPWIEIDDAIDMWVHEATNFIDEAMDAAVREACGSAL